jgi:hypothetical protein
MGEGEHRIGGHPLKHLIGECPSSLVADHALSSKERCVQNTRWPGHPTVTGCRDRFAAAEAQEEGEAITRSLITQHTRKDRHAIPRRTILMNRCDFFSDEPPSEPLPRWATITQVSDALDVSRHLIHYTARRAVAQSEPWVKKEIADTGKPIYLIDTEHETYTTHAKRWKQQTTKQSTPFVDSDARWSRTGRSRLSQNHSEEEEALLSSDSSPFTHVPWLEHDNGASGLDHWHFLRQWLSIKDLQIFKNILDEEEQTHPWRWRWGELEGKGCQDVEEAVVLALQTKLQSYEGARLNEEGARLKQDAAFVETLPEEEPPPPQRFRFFSQRKEPPLV